MAWYRGSPMPISMKGHSPIGWRPISRTCISLGLFFTCSIGIAQQATPDQIVASWVAPTFEGSTNTSLLQSLFAVGSLAEPGLIGVAIGGPGANAIATYTATAGASYDAIQAELLSHPQRYNLDATALTQIQSETREGFITTQVNSIVTNCQANALAALANVGDSKGIATIQSFASNSSSPLQSVAVSLIANIFPTFSAATEIEGGTHPSFEVDGKFSIAPNSGAVNPMLQMVILKVGTFVGAIPPESFTRTKKGSFSFEGTITGVNQENVTMEMTIKPLGNNSFSFTAEGTGLSAADATKPIVVGLIIGNHTGSTAMNR
jgi:hypothetical protein